MPELCRFLGIIIYMYREFGGKHHYSHIHADRLCGGKGWMHQLKNLAYFRRVKLNDGDNLEWPDGQDFNPEALHDWSKFRKAYIDDAKST